MGNLPKTYKDLIFWQKSFETSVLIINLAKKLSRDLGTKIILSQLFRSSMSVTANISEGYGRFGVKEFPRYLQVSLGSANETECWLLLLKECQPKYSNEIEATIERNKEVIKMLAANIKTIRNKVK